MFGGSLIGRWADCERFSVADKECASGRLRLHAATKYRLLCETCPSGSIGITISSDCYWKGTLDSELRTVPFGPWKNVGNLSNCVLTFVFRSFNMIPGFIVFKSPLGSEATFLSFQRCIFLLLCGTRKNYLFVGCFIHALSDYTMDIRFKDQVYYKSTHTEISLFHIPIDLP